MSRARGLLLTRLVTYRQLLCREHGEAVAQEFLRRTLVEGWWGLMGLFRNIVAISHCASALKQARALPFAAGPVQPVAATTPEDVVVAATQSATDRSARRGVFWAMMAAIGLGMVFLVLPLMFFSPEDTSLQTWLLLGSVLPIFVYVSVAFIVRAKVRDGSVRPRFAEGSEDNKAVLLGGAVGLFAAVVIVSIVSAVNGEIGSDPSMVAVLYERAWIHVGITLVLSVIAAPLVEEFLFRGLVVESLRFRGRGASILAGAIGFSLWHLNPNQLVYYALMGLLLGMVYWRFGLNGSIAAHAVFNATLLVVAFAVVSGEGRTTTSGMVSFDLPAGWREVEAAEVGALFEVDVAVEAPTGSAFIVQHVDQPPGTVLGDLASNLPPGASDAREVAVGEGTGLRFSVEAGGELSESIYTARGSRVYVVTFVSAGSDRAERQFDGILRSFVFAPA